MSNKLQLSKKFEKDSAEGKGMMFIIPNSASSSKTTWLAGGIDKALSSFDKELIKNDKFVQIWCHTDGNPESNWQCHTEESFKDFQFNGLAKGHFSTYLPASWLKDKKEGDTICIDVLDEKGEKVLAQYKLLCQQSGTRFKQFGKFEEVLSRVTA